MTPQHKPSSDEELVEVARPAVVNGFPLWIFENLDEESELSSEEEGADNVEASADLTTVGSSIQPGQGQHATEEAAEPRNQSEADVCPNAVPLSVHGSHALAPQHKPSTDVARPAVVNGFPLWIFENLDEESELSSEEEGADNVEASADLTTVGSSIQPGQGQHATEEAAEPRNQSEADVCPNAVPLSVHGSHALAPQHKPSTDVARPAVVNGFPLWIFENLDEDSDSTDEEYDSFCSRPTAAQERPATSSDRDSGNRVDSDSVNTVVQNDMNSRNAVSSPASQGTSNAAQDSVVDGSNGALNAGNPASGHGSSSIQSQKRTNKTADSTASHIPTAIFDTFNGDSDTTAEILEDLNSLPYDPISLNNIKHEMACSDNESGCTNRILNDLANGSDDGRSRFPSKQMKLHTGEGIVQISDFPPVTTTNSDGSSDLFSVSPVEDDCRQQLDMVESEPTQTSVEREQHTENVTHDRPITPPAQHTILGSVTTNESAIGKLQPNVGDFLRSTIEAKIQLHESLRSMLPGLFAKQVAESQQSDLLPLIVQKQFLINLVAAGLKRSYCRNADLGCIITIAAQLAYGNPDAACLLWRS